MSAVFARAVTRLRWIIVVVWLAAVVASMLFLPNLAQVVAHNNPSYIPDSSPVIQAAKWANKVDPKHSSPSSAIVAIHRNGPLTHTDQIYFDQTLNGLTGAHPMAGVVYVENKSSNDASVASKFVSRDQTTEIAVVGLSYDIGSKQLGQAISQLHARFASPPADAHVYFTGDAPIQQENLDISQQGVNKTAVVTVVLVLVILFAVFRSLLAPIVTLLAIGMSFLIASGIVAWLVRFGLPVSNFTETFLVAVLFGAGTDYSIIIINRFREEMVRHELNREAALRATLRGIGKTVVFSSLTVIVSFAVLGLAKFGLYQSAVGVSIGIAIALATCLIFVPAVLTLLGGALYWPRKLSTASAHSQSRMWGWTARVSTRRPWLVIMILLVVLVPISLLFTDDRTFNPMSDIPQASSVQGFGVVSNAFGQGQALPSTVVLKTPENLRSSAGLATIDHISRALGAVPTVHEIDSATQPAGAALTDFQISHQNQIAADALQKVNTGLQTLGGKFGSAVTPSTGHGAEGLGPLVTGSQQVTSGAAALRGGLQSLTIGSQKVQSGSTAVASGTATLSSGLHQLVAGGQSLSSGANAVAGGLSQASQGASSLAAGSKQLASGTEQAQQLAVQLANAMAQWAAAHPAAAQGPSWQALMTLAQTNAGVAKSLSTGAQQVETGAGRLSTSTTQLAHGAQSVAQGSQSLTAGIAKVASGGQQLQVGSAKVAQGAAALTTGASQLGAGANRLVAGSQQVTGGINQANQVMMQDLGGLQSANQGIAQMASGVHQVTQFLRGTHVAITHGDPGFYVPESTIQNNSGLQKALDTYISPDGHVAKFTVIFSVNPYSTTALNAVSAINNAAQSALLSSPIHTGTVLATGTTPTQTELNNISTQDFVRTMIIILGAIFLLLAVMLRSLIAPAYIILSLGGTYFATMGLLQFITIHILQKPGLSWPVPFFVFLLLVALGVDYSIFLMTRFEESLEHGSSPRAAIREAMGHMGNVIFSAALIMAGTFGSMMVAGVMSLVEIGLGIVIGLLLYTVVFLAFFIPAAVSVVGAGHGWPFKVQPASGRIPSRRVAVRDR